MKPTSRSNTNTYPFAVNEHVSTFFSAKDAREKGDRPRTQQNHGFGASHVDAGNHQLTNVGVRFRTKRHYTSPAHPGSTSTGGQHGLA